MSFIGIAGLQAAVKDPSSVKGVQLLDISLRQLHVRNQSPLAKPFVKAFQNILVETFVGDWFFSQVAQPSVRFVLHLCLGQILDRLSHFGEKLSLCSE